MIILVLLSTFGGVHAVGQIGGGVALGRKNGAKSQNTERSRRGFLRKFDKYLELIDLSTPEFYEKDNIQQCGYLKQFFSCLRKEKSYRTKEQRVCFFVFSQKNVI